MTLIFFKNKIFKTFIVIFFFLLFYPVYAQQSQNKVYLTMDDAISRALSKNNQVRSSKFAIKRANWEKKNSWTMLFPSLSLTTRYMWIDDSTFALRDFSY